MEYTIESLVSLVHDNPFIYDKRLPGYKDKALIKRTWHSIAEEFTPDWEDLSSSKKKLEVKFYMNKWRSVRDTYKKELTKLRKLEKSGSAAPAPPTYKNFELLSFLRTIYEPRRTEDSFSTSTNVEADSDSTCASANSNSDAGDNVSEVPSTHTSGSAHSSLTTVRPRPRPATRPKRVRPAVVDEEENVHLAQMNKTYQEILEHFKSNRERQRSPEENVAYKITDSMVPYLMDIDPRYYADVHGEFIDAAKKYLAKTRQDRDGNQGNKQGSNLEGSSFRVPNQGTYQECWPSDKSMPVHRSEPQHSWIQQGQAYSSMPPSQMHSMGRPHRETSSTSRTGADVGEMYHRNPTQIPETRSYHNLDRPSAPCASQTTEFSMTRFMFDYDATE
ncbi:uncharacterized protein [Hyperolius riggenbachi]|uniref:uncharacterized protein n=1 Tax=Hyperolius riggenbachi TaxID=752182 RepID=UPI0035A3B7EF